MVLLGCFVAQTRGVVFARTGDNVVFVRESATCSIPAACRLDFADRLFGASVITGLDCWTGLLDWTLLL